MKIPHSLIYVRTHEGTVIKVPNRIVARMSYVADHDKFTVISEDPSINFSVPAKKLIGTCNDVNEVICKILAQADAPWVVPIDTAAETEIHRLLKKDYVLQRKNKSLLFIGDKSNLHAEAGQHPTIRVFYNTLNSFFVVTSVDSKITYTVPRDNLVGDFRSFGEVLGRILKNVNPPQLISIHSSARAEIDLIWDANVLLFPFPESENT